MKPNSTSICNIICILSNQSCALSSSRTSETEALTLYIKQNTGTRNIAVQTYLQHIHDFDSNKLRHEIMSLRLLKICKLVFEIDNDTSLPWFGESYGALACSIVQGNRYHDFRDVDEMSSGHQVMKKNTELVSNLSKIF